MSNTRFLLLWGLGSIACLFTSAIVGMVIFIAGGMLVTGIWGEQLLGLTSATALVIVGIWFGSVGLSVGLVFGSIQKAILRTHTREPWRGWLLASSIGGVIGILGFVALLAFQGMGYYLMQVLPAPDTLLWWTFEGLMLFFGSLGIFQMLALRQYITGAWVWIIANLVAAIVFYSLITFGVLSWAVTPLIGIVLGVLVAAAPGIVTGFALVWLMNSNWRQGY